MIPNGFALNFNGRDATDTTFIAIGHSFGARLLFSGTGQILINEVQEAHPGFPGGQYGLVSGPTDAVVLLNPAFEASLFTTFNSVTRTEESFAQNQAPLVLSIATDADIPTHYLFPVGQWLGGMRHPEERTTLGNYGEFFTHRLAPSQQGTCNHCSHFSGIRTVPGRRTLPGKIGHGKFVPPFNPFIVARTNRDVINGHNDVWNLLFRTGCFG